MMPYVEPYFVRSMRAATAEIDDPALLSAADRFVREEAAHHAQHRVYNAVVRQQYPRVVRLERWMDRIYGWLSRTRSVRFNLAFTAGTETIGFGLARWTEKHLPMLLKDADPEVARLYVWHLSEEVAHKELAHDVYTAIDGSRLRYAISMTISLCLVAWFTLWGTLVMLGRDRKLWNPMTYARMIKWSVGCAFELLPLLAVSVMPSHHPSRFVDPVLYQSLATDDELHV